jgi:phage tail-like protein
LKIDPTFPYDLFKFLIRSLREADSQVSDTLERFLERPQYWFETLIAQIDSSPTLLDPVTCPDEWLPELAKHVGWTEELKQILDLVEENDDLRKLVILAVPLWKVQGTQQGIVNALRVFTGKTVAIDDWFDLRWIIDIAGLDWVTLPGGGPWVIGGLGGPFDEYVSDLYIQDDPTLNHDLVEKLVEVLLRPANERYYVIYCDFLDTWERELEQWSIQAGAPAIVADALALSAGDEILSETVDRWRNMVYRFDFEFSNPGRLVCTFQDLRPYAGTDYYYISIIHATQTIELYRYTFPAAVLLGSWVNPIGFGTARWGIMIRSQIVVGGAALEVYLDGDLKISVVDVAVDMPAGAIGYEATAAAAANIYRPTVIILPGTVVKVPSWL